MCMYIFQVFLPPIKIDRFYRTQVYLGSDLWVRVSLTH